MNTNATSREAILQACRRIVAEEGVQALSMRRVAEACGIALGTLYNYYADKNALVLATVESIWRDIFHADPADSAGLSFPQYVETLFSRIQRGAAQYRYAWTTNSSPGRRRTYSSSGGAYSSRALYVSGSSTNG